MICEIICIDGFLCMSHLDIVHMLSAYVHVIHILSGHMCIMRTLFAVVSAHCLHTHTLLMSSAYCLQMHILCTSHFYCCYLHMYMSSAYYLSICVLCAHYLEWSLMYSFLTDNANVIHMSFLVLFIYPIMYNLVSAHCLHRRSLAMSFACCPHMYTSFACHVYHSSYILLFTT